MNAVRSVSVILWVGALASASLPRGARAEIEVFGTSPPDFEIVGATASSPVFAQVLASVNSWDIECHPDTGLIYFSDPTAGIIGSIDPTVALPSVTTIVSRPAGVLHGIALDVANNRLFFLDSADNTINFVDLGTFVQTLFYTDPSIVRPNDIAYDPVREWVIVTDSGADGIGYLKTDLTFGNALGSPETAGAWGAAVSPVTGEIYFSSFDNGTIHRLDVSVPLTPVTIAVATGLSGPRGLQFDRFGRLFCLESGLDRVVQIDLGTGTPVAPAFASAVNGRGFVIFEGDDKDGDFLLDEWERRHVASILSLNGSSDPEGDGNSAFEELLFNGTPGSGSDGLPFRTLEYLPGGDLQVVFEGPSSGYGFEVWLSSNLVNWQEATEVPTVSPTADVLFNSYEYLIDAAGEGGILDPARVFVRVVGNVEGP